MDAFEKLKEVAVEISPDYPNIETAEPLEQLYAIKASYQGCCKANEDMHVLANVLRAKLGMSLDDYIKLGDEVSKLRGFYSGESLLTDKEIIKVLGHA